MLAVRASTPALPPTGRVVVAVLGIHVGVGEGVRVGVGVGVGVAVVSVARPPVNTRSRTRSRTHTRASTSSGFTGPGSGVGRLVGGCGAPGGEQAEVTGDPGEGGTVRVRRCVGTVRVYSSRG